MPRGTWLTALVLKIVPSTLVGFGGAITTGMFMINKRRVDKKKVKKKREKKKEREKREETNLWKNLWKGVSVKCVNFFFMISSLQNTIDRESKQ